MDEALEFEAGRWQANWIWSHNPGVVARGPMGGVAGQLQSGWAMLRREFNLDQVPEHAPARLTADSRYVLHVNGVELARGPVRGNLRRLHYDTIDLADVLQPGRNVIAVLARFFGKENAWWAPAPAAGQLGAGAFVFELRLDDEMIVSDDRWRGLPGEAWDDLLAHGVSAMPSERCDARGLPADWTDLEFDDSEWSFAVMLRADSMGFSGDHRPPSQPYGPLLPRTLSPLTRRSRDPQTLRIARASAPHDDDATVRPFDLSCGFARDAGSFETVSLPFTVEGGEGAAEVVLADFGEVVAGSVRFEVEALAGARIDVAAIERLDDEGRPEPLGEEGGFGYITRGESDRYETASVYGMRALALSIRSSAPVTIRSLSVTERVYPRPDGPFFKCSDELLNRVHSVGRRTVDLCSHDAYLDCPTREQRAWTGDSVVHQMVDLATNPDWGLARWHPEMAASPRPDGMLPMAVAGDLEYRDRAFIPDWALHWVRALHNLYRYTGDRETIGRLLPVAERVLRWFDDFTTRDGLVSDVMGWVIIEWSSVSVLGKSSVLNALFARALRDFAEMCEWQTDAGRARWARDRISRLALGFELFWDEGRGLYVDHAVAGAPRRPVSQHAQAAALAAGLVPTGRVASVADAMVDEDRLVHAAWQMATGDSRFPRDGEGLLSANYLYAGPPEPWWDVEKQIVRAQPFFRYVVHDALSEIGREDSLVAACRDWKALLERCPTTLSETWYGGTTCHGWSATPTRDLVTRTLGITPAEPGFGRVRIAPRLGDLAWVRGAAPTPAGLVHVDVDADRVEIDSPVPIELELMPGKREELPAGTHRLARDAEGARRNV